VCIDGNKLKNERKCTPCIEKMTENVRWAKGDSVVGDLLLYGIH